MQPDDPGLDPLDDTAKPNSAGLFIFMLCAFSGALVAAIIGYATWSLS